MQFGSLQLGQFLHLTFFVATLLDNISFCSSGFNLLNSSISIIFLFCSSAFCIFSFFGCSSFASPFISFNSSLGTSLFTFVGFLLGNFFGNL
jgi:hypothetical protein